jgi:molybdate transport system substrate-binding protein
MIEMQRYVAFLLIGSMGLAGCSRSAPETPVHSVRVAAASDLKFAFDDLSAEFRQTHPDIEVIVSYGSSGNFFAQISNGAPFDLFLSADLDYPRQLIEKGHAEPGSEFTYAIGHLVVWVRKDSPLDFEKQGMRALLDPSAKHVAIANARYAPYGRAAEAALKKLGVYEEVKDRLVIGDNVSQTAQFVATGAAEVGLFGLSQALAPTLREDGRYWNVPLDAYPRIEQGGVILKAVQDRGATETLRDFLRGEQGRAVLQRYGFVLP